MLALELVIVLLAIFLGARLGGIGIGFAGGLGVLVLALIGVKPGSIPFDVISIIMAVIAAISAMQVAGGMDYLVQQTEKLLRKNPKHITILAPIVTYFLTIFAGTGNISLSALPVIAEVAKEQGIKPCRPLSTAVVSAQIAITASPISAAVVYMSSVMEGHGVSYLHLLMVVIPSTFCAVLVMSLLVTWLFDSKLSNDPVYLKRLEEGLITLRGNNALAIKPRAKASVLLFLLGVLCVVAYAIINSPGLGLVAKPLMNTTNAILIIMLSVATLTTLLCRVDTDMVLNSSTFQGRHERLYLYPRRRLAGRYLRAGQHRLDQRDGRQRHSGAPVAAGGDLLLLLGAAVLAGRHRQGADADGAGAERIAADRRRLLRRRLRPVHPADLPNAGRRGADGRYRHHAHRPLRVQPSVLHSRHHGRDLRRGIRLPARQHHAVTLRPGLRPRFSFWR